MMVTRDLVNSRGRIPVFYPDGKRVEMYPIDAKEVVKSGTCTLNDPKLVSPEVPVDPEKPAEPESSADNNDSEVPEGDNNADGDALDDILNDSE